VRWRLLRDGAADGPWNMGVDEALLASAAHGGPPSLRLYGWRGPWLSLGYGQQLLPERRRACEAVGVGVVQRATGGLAVLHGADLTYCVAAPEGVLPRDLAGSYGLLAGALLEGLRRLGVTARCVARSQAVGESFDCFASSGLHEIVTEGGKLCGSAQRRVRGAVLQHGSLRLGPDPPEACAASGIHARGAASLAGLGCPASWDEVADAIVLGFTSVFGSFQPGVLSPPERRRAGGRRLLAPRGWAPPPQGAPEAADTH
jgi:lipoate-protein ligase A